jgi:hypothetical protein
MFFTSALQVVFKTTGGRIWNKPWGLPRLTRTRKANRRKNLALFNKNISVLKAAAAQEPAEAVRLNAPLPQWQRRYMLKQLDRAQQLLNWRGTLLPPAAAAAAAANAASSGAEPAAGRLRR